MLAGRLFQILGAATANTRDAVAVLVLGCCNRCLAYTESGSKECSFCTWCLSFGMIFLCTVKDIYCNTAVMYSFIFL